MAVAQYYYAMRLKDIDGISMTSYNLIVPPIIINPAYSFYVSHTPQSKVTRRTNIFIQW